MPETTPGQEIPTQGHTGKLGSQGAELQMSQGYRLWVLEGLRGRARVKVTGEVSKAQEMGECLRVERRPGQQTQLGTGPSPTE